MSGFRTKNCQRCGVEYQQTGYGQKHCPECRLILRRERCRVWKRAHPEQCKAYGISFREKYPEYMINWDTANRQKRRLFGRRENAQRRILGFNPLNSPFPGCEAHHVNQNDIIYIPRTLHRSIKHNRWTGEGIAEINTLARQYLMETQP